MYLYTTVEMYIIFVACVTVYCRLGHVRVLLTFHFWCNEAAVLFLAMILLLGDLPYSDVSNIYFWNCVSSLTSTFSAVKHWCYICSWSLQNWWSPVYKQFSANFPRFSRIHWAVLAPHIDGLERLSSAFTLMKTLKSSPNSAKLTFLLHSINYSLHCLKRAISASVAYRITTNNYKPSLYKGTKLFLKITQFKAVSASPYNKIHDLPGRSHTANF